MSGRGLAKAYERGRKHIAALNAGEQSGPVRFTINIRYYAGAYVARAVGKLATASSTQTAFFAAERCAEKMFGQDNYVLNKIDEKTYVASEKEPA